MNNPLVSIAVPVYNGGQWLSATLDSILAQTYTHFELVICDNASDDETPEICRQYAKKDARVRFFENERNIGAALNFNRAFELSSGTYFKWASSNDLISPCYLEKCVPILDANDDVVVAFTKTQIINESDEVTELYPEELTLEQSSAYDRFRKFVDNVQLNNVEQGLMRRDVLAQTSLQEVYPNSDTVLMSEMAARGKFIQIDEHLLSRRFAESSTTNLLSEEEVAAFFFPGKSHIPMQTFRMFLSFLKIAFRVPVSTTERLKFLGFAGKFLYWNLGDVAADLKSLITQK